MIEEVSLELEQAEYYMLKNFVITLSYNYLVQSSCK